ncbi:MAG: PP2C family serine/threonine-protein phosphatase [Sulfurovum sp.]
MQTIETHRSTQLEFRVPNGSVGVAYKETLRVEGITIKYIYGLETISGLSLNSSTHIIEGTPKRAGDFSLRVKTSIGDSYLHITINPNPKSLWQNIAPDKNAIFFKDNHSSLYIETPDNTRLLSVSQRGRSHAHNGKFRDDDALIAYSDSGWSILAVADGAGSCSLSRRGSQIAVDSSVEALMQLLDNDTDETEELLLAQESMIKSVSKALLDIEEEAKAIDRDIKEFSTTLLLSAHKKIEDGRHCIITFWVGDGALALYREGKDVTILGSPDSSEYAGETRFLDHNTLKDAQVRVTASIVDDFTALILLTDGISDPFFRTDDELNSIDMWDKMFEYDGLREIINNRDIEIATKELLEWLDFWKVGSHDDRSMTVLKLA